MNLHRTRGAGLVAVRRFSHWPCPPARADTVTDWNAIATTSIVRRRASRRRPRRCASRWCRAPSTTPSTPSTEAIAPISDTADQPVGLQGGGRRDGRVPRARGPVPVPAFHAAAALRRLAGRGPRRATQGRRDRRRRRRRRCDARRTRERRRDGAFGFPIGSEPCAWRPTPPTFALDPAPWGGNVRPFLVPSAAMIRSDPPTRSPAARTRRTSTRSNSSARWRARPAPPIRPRPRSSGRTTGQRCGTASFARSRQLAGSASPTPRACSRAPTWLRPTARSAAGEQVPLEVLAADHRDPRGPDGRQPGHRGRPGVDTAVRPHHAAVRHAARHAGLPRNTRPDTAASAAPACTLCKTSSAPTRSPSAPSAHAPAQPETTTASPTRLRRSSTPAYGAASTSAPPTYGAPCSARRSPTGSPSTTSNRRPKPHPMRGRDRRPLTPAVGRGGRSQPRGLPPPPSVAPTTTSIRAPRASARRDSCPARQLLDANHRAGPSSRANSGRTGLTGARRRGSGWAAAPRPSGSRVPPPAVSCRRARGAQPGHWRDAAVTRGAGHGLGRGVQPAQVGLGAARGRRSEDYRGDPGRASTGGPLGPCISRGRRVLDAPRGGWVDASDGGGIRRGRIRHRVSRAGDAQLHSHVVMANLTRADGRWTTLDGRAL
jgi:TrwC relaxase